MFYPFSKITYIYTQIGYGADHESQLGGGGGGTPRGIPAMLTGGGGGGATGLNPEFGGGGEGIGPGIPIGGCNCGGAAACCQGFTDV